MKPAPPGSAPWRAFTAVAPGGRPRAGSSGAFWCRLGFHDLVRDLTEAVSQFKRGVNKEPPGMTALAT